MLEDHIEYSLPGGALSEMIASRLIGKKLNQMLDIDTVSLERIFESIRL